jgi:hypothetical protein
MRILSLLCCAGLAGATGATGAHAQAPRRTLLEGRWEARGPDDAIRHIMVRPDSSAQFGDDIARWRVVGDSLWLTLGDGVWMVYGMALKGERLTLSGGDLEKPVTLKRVGPALPRADSLKVPDPPPPTARAF